VDGELGGDRSQEADLGGDLCGQVGESDRRVAGVALERGLGRRDPRVGTLGAQMPLRCLGDERSEPLGTRFDQQVRVA